LFYLSYACEAQGNQALRHKSTALARCHRGTLAESVLCCLKALLFLGAVKALFGACLDEKTALHSHGAIKALKQRAAHIP